MVIVSSQAMKPQPFSVLYDLTVPEWKPPVADSTADLAARMTPPPPPDDIDVEAMTEAEEKEFAELHNALFQDFELADAFKEAIVPSAVLWFTGEADDEEDRDDDDGDDDDGGMGRYGEASELADDDDDDEADPNYKPPDNAPECKQS